MIPRRIRATLSGAVVAAAAIALLAPASAGAAQAVYPPDANAQSFFTNNGGWTHAKDESGLCLTMLTCPEVTNGYRATNGTLGATDGHIRTVISSLAGVGGEVRGIWVGPAFTYLGVNGRQPRSGVFTLARQSDLGALLSVAGNAADTTVDLVDTTAGGTSTRIVNNLGIVQTRRWARIAPVSVNPASLVIGHVYVIRIISRFAFGAQVNPGGYVGYDDIVLGFRTGRGTGTDPFGVAGLLGGGQNAFFDGKHLYFKMKCLGVQKAGKCRVRATALTKKGGKRVTFPISRKVKAKKGKIVRARVRPKFRDKLERSSKVVLRSKIIAGSRKHPAKKKVKFRKLKLIQRGA
jgi:hypothetical protein